MASPTALTTDEFRLLTWSRPALTRMTIKPKSLQRHCPLDNGRLERCKTIPGSSMGKLEILPIEIIHAIFDVLDLQTVTDFRGVSWRARALVDHFPAYNAIFQHSSDALRALLSTNMAIHFTAKNIFDALCTKNCASCGHFGPFLDLFTGNRHCITCVAQSDELLSITKSSAMKDFTLSSKSVRKLPTLLSIPGQYTESEKTYQRRLSLVRMSSAATAVPAQRGTGQNASRSSGPVQSQPSIALRTLRSRDHHGQNPYRYMAMLRIPFLDPRTRELDWGVSCQACRLGPRDEERGYRDWNIVYSAAEYMEHFQICEVSRIARKVVLEYVGAITAKGRDSESKFLGYLNNSRF